MNNNFFAYILNSKVTALRFEEIVKKIENWVDMDDKQKYVCVCNTHSLVTAAEDEKFNQVLDNAEICTPDGMPLVWALKAVGYKEQDRVDGPNLMLKLCEQAEIKGYKVYFYGGTEEVLDRLNKHLLHLYPNLQVVGTYSPPFRSLSDEEKKEINNRINASSADLVFTSLGCPKQELWMYENSKAINSILLGVGAAFNFIIGDIKRPPAIFQKIGLEWLFRLICEPKRLWKRYLYNNTRYIYYYAKTFNKNKVKTLNVTNHVKNSDVK
ncbi:WecB/TagA/CpsF family glycosyltransferase [Peribacillus sp. FSL M8-0224]|uniref:WecB/TagA/CpsF family glycosyltransferase n=1 Tax=Peribacillus sp. FSL M8-0224 TaxID=2921568 RepID=UPI0030F7C4C3